MTEAGEDRRARGRGLVAAIERFAGLEQGEALRRVDAERFEHFGREDFAHAAFQGQPAIGVAAVRGLSRSLGAEIEQAAAVIAKLRESEPAAVADLRVVHAKLVTVITQGQRLGRLSGSGANRQKWLAQRSSSRLSPIRSAQRRLRKRGMHFGNLAGSTAS